MYEQDNAVYGNETSVGEGGKHWCFSMMVISIRDA
jgi:hypothetical protein